MNRRTFKTNYLNVYTVLNIFFQEIKLGLSQKIIIEGIYYYT